MKTPKNDFCAEFGAKLRQARGKESMAHAAAETGLGCESIRMYEAGRVEPGIEAFRRLCKHYNADANMLLGLK